MVIYLDVLLFENFIVNFFLIHITAQTIRVKLKLVWHVISAFLGSLYVLVLLYPSLSIFTSLPFKLLAALIIIFLAFRNIKIIFNLKATVIYILYSILLAGMCFFIELNKSYQADMASIIYEFSYKKLLLALMIFYIILYRVVVYIKDRKDIEGLIYEVNIKTKASFKTVKAFLDTGNKLKEPATNLPVMIVDKSFFDDMDTKNCDKYYIPYKVINGYRGRLEGFRPEYIEIKVKGNMQKREVIIALSEGKLCEFNEYEALLSRGII